MKGLKSTPSWVTGFLVVNYLEGFSFLLWDSGFSICTMKALGSVISEIPVIFNIRT